VGVGVGVGVGVIGLFICDQRTFFDGVQRYKKIVKYRAFG